MLRDPGRIPEVLDALAKLWNKYPDWRFGQLISNVFAVLDEDVFYTEDDDWERIFKNFLANGDKYFEELNLLEIDKLVNFDLSGTINELKRLSKIRDKSPDLFITPSGVEALRSLSSGDED